VFRLSPKASYAVSGWAGVVDEETGVHIPFDGECNDVANALDMGGFTDLKSYGEAFARTVGERVQRKIGEARERGSITPEDYVTKIVNKDRWSILHFDGYWRGVPSMAAWTILFHLDQSSVKEYYCPQQVLPDDRYFVGSGPMLNLLEATTDSGPFEKYKIPSFKKLIARRGVSLQEAIEAATSYIEACSQPEAQDLDDDCKFIGGRVRIATIKPVEGFEWASGSEPL
jgi:hypothetical protein